MLKETLTHLYIKLFAKPRFYSLNRFLIVLGLRSVGILNYRSYEESGEKFLISEVLPELIPRNPILFDVGAHEGTFSALLSKEFPSGVIYSFEPCIGPYRILSGLHASNVQPYQIALGRNRTQSMLFVPKGDPVSQHSSLMDGVVSQIHQRDVYSQAVDLWPIDEFVMSEGISRIDFLKLDVEGYEYEVLSGAKEMLGNNSVTSILFEFNEMNIISRQFMSDYKNLLSEYYFYRLLPSGIIQLPNETYLSEIFAYQNIFAIHNSKLAQLNQLSF